MHALCSNTLSEGYNHACNGRGSGSRPRPFGGLSVRTDIRGLIRPADIRADVRADIRPADIRPADIRRISVFLCADFHTIFNMIVYKMITILHK